MANVMVKQYINEIRSTSEKLYDTTDNAEVRELAEAVRKLASVVEMLNDE